MIHPLHPKHEHPKGCWGRFMISGSHSWLGNGRERIENHSHLVSICREQQGERSLLVATVYIAISTLCISMSGQKSDTSDWKGSSSFARPGDRRHREWQRRDGISASCIVDSSNRLRKGAIYHEYSAMFYVVGSSSKFCSILFESRKGIHPEDFEARARQEEIQTHRHRELPDPPGSRSSG